MIVLQILATIRGRQTLAVAAPLVLTAIGFVVALVVCSLGDRFQGPVDRFSRAVGSAVSRVCFLALGVFVVILPWVAHRIFRIDPLAAPRSASGATAWIERGRRDLQPASPWAADPAVLRPTLWFRVRQIVAVPVVLVAAILAFAAIPTKGFEDETKGPTYHAPTVFEDSPWYQDYEQDINWYMTIGFDPTRNPRLRDAHSRYVNVVDGARTSWTPAACDCRRLVVWVYGGSTTFGIGQRDEHTIPSELARLASEDGIAIDVVNRGVPGDLHWMEANRFAWDIAVNDPPDLVVFYDGINEMMAAFQAQDTGRSTSMTAPIDPTMEKLGDRDLAQFGYQGSNPADGPADAAVDPPKALPTVEAEEFGAMAAKRYEASRTASRALAEAEGVPVAWFWQPSLYTRTHKVEGEPDDDPAGDEFNEAIWASARDHLADDVVDLTPTLEDRDVGVFFDGMHTNELGSRLVAEGMYRSLRDQLRALVEEQP